MAEAKAKHKQTRIQRALDEVAAARAAKLAGEAPVAQAPTPLPPNTRLSATESTDRFGRVWRTPSVCLQKPLASGELRWWGLETNDLNSYRGSRTPKHEEVFTGLDGKRCRPSF
jgi:hypothetical protein